MENSSSSEEDVLEKTRKAELGKIRMIYCILSYVINILIMSIFQHYSCVHDEYHELMLILEQCSNLPILQF